MPFESKNHAHRLTGHALRNAHLRERSLARAQLAPRWVSMVRMLRRFPAIGIWSGHRRERAGRREWSPAPRAGADWALVGQERRLC